VTPMAISWIVFACVFGGALLGMVLRVTLPSEHLSADSKDVVKLGMGLVATMSALVLSLLVASAKSSFDLQGTQLTQMAGNIVLLDRVLAHYGPEAKDAREALRTMVAATVARVWSENAYHSEKLDSAETRAAAAAFYDKVHELSPRDDLQRSLRADAWQISLDIGRARSLLLEDKSSAIPVPFLVVLIFWLTILFTGFGLFAPPNATVIGVLCVCALSVSFAIFLILELDRPFQGLMQISGVPLRNALARLGQ
jgi:Protein of unknown function (DUF4239)